jgi:molecular chaperone GrpE
MNNEHNQTSETATPQPGPGADPANQNAPQTPEQVMQAAAARIETLEKEAADMKERWMRAEAENANVRARAKRDADDARQYAVQKFAVDVVEAAENLRRGIGALPPPAPDQPDILNKVREGLEGVERNFVGILERNGIKKEDPTGQPFDPNLHQAMAEQESDIHKPGTVMQAWTAAWTLHGRLLRPAMVVVAKAPLGEIASTGLPLDTTA